MNNKKLNLQLFAKLIGLAVIGGMAAPFAKYALKEIPVFGYTFCRLVIGSLALYGMLRATNQRPDTKIFKRFAPIAAFWWLNAFIYTLGLKLTNATTAQLIHTAVPIITALLAIFILKERLTRTQWLGSLVALSGVGVVVVSKGSLSFQNLALIGNLLILISAFCFSLYNVLSKSERFVDITATQMVFVASVTGAIVGFIPAMIELSSNSWLTAVSTQSLGAMLIAATTISIFYLGFQKLIKKNGPSIASTNLYLLPVSVAVWAYVLLGEKMTQPIIAGGLLALLGVAIFSRKAKPAKS